MRLLKLCLLGMGGMSFGLLSAAGVFTVLIAVGLVPRFAGKTHTASYILLYEELVIWGTVCGMLFSVFSAFARYSSRMLSHCKIPAEIIIGFFTGCFVGCLAISIAEMLDSIPIFARRIHLKRGLGIVVLFVALGKLCGSLVYYLFDIGYF